ASHGPGSRLGFLPAARRDRPQNDHGRDRPRRRARAPRPARADGRRAYDCASDPRPFKYALSGPAVRTPPHAPASLIARPLEHGQKPSHLNEIAVTRVVAQTSAAMAFACRNEPGLSGEGAPTQSARGHDNPNEAWQNIAKESFRKEPPCWRKPKARNASMTTSGRMRTCANSSRGLNARARSLASKAPIGSSKWARWPKS